MKVGAHYLGEGRCQFTVWAPHVESAAVQILAPEQRTIALTCQLDEQLHLEYWQSIVEQVYPGTLYRYQLNDFEAHPDPASQFQPHGVHGASQVVDHQFEWTDQNWAGIPLESMIFYELHVGTFTPEGTFAAIIPRLKDLKALGINAIELM
ncbi:MAG TPA: malto-oligosyltrehalose trehalohydrolase, partial [Allocoleopsis sp.]